MGAAVKKVLAVLTAIMLIGSLLPYAAAAGDIDAQYTFNYYGDAIPSPPAVRFARTLSGPDLGIDVFKSPEDMYITENGDIYIVDNGQNRIVICDKDYKLKFVLGEFTHKEEKTRLSSPSGIFVDETTKEIYIADTNNARVLVCTTNGNVTRELTIPQDGVIKNFQPQKLIKDISGNLCVVSGGTNEGIMHFDKQDKFMGFMGAPKVQVNLSDLFWRNFMTVEQKEKTTLITPIIYSNLDIDREGVIYSTVKTTNINEAQKFRKLSPGGQDITRSMGNFPPNGDPFPVIMGFNSEGMEYKNSLLVDVVTYDNGIFSVLDQTMGRVFTYDEDGNLLFAFGNKGNAAGAFSLPVAIEHHQNRLFVLDKNQNAINIFETTEYGDSLMTALKEYKTGNYDLSLELYQKIVNENINNEIGYIGIGKNLLIKGEYAGAREAFRLGNYRYGYSEAFDMYRRDFISQNFSWIFLVGAILVFGLIAWVVFITREKRRVAVSRSYAGTLKFSLHTMSRPFDGFSDLVNEKRGSFIAATTLLLIFIVVYICNKQYTGFLFNTIDMRQFSLPKEILTVLFAFFAWVIVNSGVSQWIYGEGKPRSIYIYTCYALTPLIILMALSTLISNVLLTNEGVFYYFLYNLGIVWFVLLIIVGNMQTHQYTMKQNLFSILICIIQIAVIIFLIMVAISLYQQTYSFISTIITEISLR